MVNSMSLITLLSVMAIITLPTSSRFSGLAQAHEVSGHNGMTMDPFMKHQSNRPGHKTIIRKKKIKKEKTNVH